MSARLETLAALALALAMFLVGLGRPMLVDPWETHYGEVARRMLADDDLILTQWQEEGFRSKPVLAPWLIAAGLRLHGLAGADADPLELARAERTSWAVRLPFALFAALGAFALFWAMRRLVGARVAWLALIVLGTSPMYLLLGRQAITDMPMVATTTGALALFALAALDEDREAPRRLGPFRAPQLVQLAIGAWVIAQVVYGLGHLGSHPALGAGPYDPRPLFALPIAGCLALFLLLSVVWPGRRARHGYLYAAYALLGVGVLAKGPPGLAMTALVGLSYVVLTRRWRLLLEVRPLDGLLIVLLVAGPWHVAMGLEDGARWVTEYIGHHWLARAAGGAHSTNAPGSESFRYYLEQLGYGLLPWIGVVPAALLGALAVARETRGVPDGRAARRSHVSLLALLWACLGVAFFTLIGTRFHHYVAPALGGFAILVALFLDDAFARRAPLATRALAVAGALAIVPIVVDVIRDPAIFLEMVTYRYDRPWPSDAPFAIPLAVLMGAACAASLAVLVSRWAPVGLTAVAAGLWLFLVGPYMEHAAPHWGMRAIVRTYDAHRRVTDPLVAWRLYWRGEVFYTSAELIELRQGTAAQLAEIAGREGIERVYVVTEAAQREGVRAAIP
ncbi:MAG: ArnT family glycosyltransferase, partial [Sandaracinaceae bacterium]